MEGRRETPGTMLWVTASALLLSVFTVFLHLKALGRGYILEYQVPRHLAMLAGTAGNPWQFRMLSAWIVEGFHRLIGAVGIHDPLIAAFVVVRVLTETAMFVIAWRYWRALDLSSAASFMGLALFGWSVSYANFGSDLQFNTYFDVLFYLVAAWLVVRDRMTWLLPLTALAALNRETSGFIPLLALATWPNDTPQARSRALRLAVAGIAIYAVVFVGTAPGVREAGADRSLRPSSRDRSLRLQPEARAHLGAARRHLQHPAVHGAGVPEPMAGVAVGRLLAAGSGMVPGALVRRRHVRDAAPARAARGRDPSGRALPVTRGAWQGDGADLNLRPASYDA
jgi:hypothetical protein